MITIKKITNNYVYASWLKNELFRNKFNLTQREIKLVQNPDLTNYIENRMRQEILCRQYNRAMILKTLPPKMVWLEVQIEKMDIKKLFILPCFEWFMDTGGTFGLQHALTFLSPFRGFKTHDKTEVPISNYQIVKNIIRNSRTLNLGYLVMISSSRRGPFSIIDGAHRAIALLRLKRLAGQKGFLGIEKNLSRCFFSIERNDIKQFITNSHKFAEMGLLW